jgi:hypothetical protein
MHASNMKNSVCHRNPIAPGRDAKFDTGPERKALGFSCEWRGRGEDGLIGHNCRYISVGVTSKAEALLLTPLSLGKNGHRASADFVCHATVGCDEICPYNDCVYFFPAGVNYPAEISGITATGIPQLFRSPAVSRAITSCSQGPAEPMELVS